MNRALKLALFMGLAASPLAAQKKKIAVMDFDYSQVRSSVSDVFGSDVDVGKAIADLVYAALQKNGSYDLAPRQPTPAANRQNPGAAQTLAQQTGADVVVMGTVAAYGKQTGQTAGISIGGFGLGKKTTIAFVQLSTQLITAAAPTPAAMAAGQGDAKGSGTSLLGNVNVAGLAANGEVKMSGGDYQKTIIGQATQKAVDDLTASVVSNAGSITPAKPAPTMPSMPSMPSAAAPATSSVPSGPLPAAYTTPVSGPFMWVPYNFQGTEHFKYTVSMVENRVPTPGIYTLDASKNGSNVQVNVVWSLGADHGTGTLIFQPGMAMISPMQLMSLGPAGALLFNPALGFMFAGQQWVPGSGWSQTHNGETVEFKVEGNCSGAGVQGSHGVVRKNGNVVWDMCVAPNVGLPLAETFNNDNGSANFTMTAVEFHP
ncbi:MAG TPA: CsgG/HfaB family protein [Gemmatimonadales bacterium]|nr:CsgG/HfaB family protein [Gemmatimonadales bacterium]